GVFNIFWGLVISSVMSAVGVMIVAGILSESEYGLVAVALTGPTLIASFRDWGVDWATIKYIAQYRSEGKEANVKSVLVSIVFFEIVLGFSLSILSFFLSGFIANILGRPSIVPLVQIASFTIFAEALLKAAQAVFTGYEKMEYHSITSIVYSSLKTGFMILLVIFGLGPFGATIGTTIAYLISGVISVILLYIAIYKNLHAQDGSGKLELFSTIKTLFRYGLPLSISSIISGFLTQFFGLLLAIYCTDLLMGNYQVALNFGFIITFFVMPIITVLLPAFSKLDSQKEGDTLGNVFQFSVKYASLIIVPIAFVVIALSQPGVSALFGAKYSYTPLYLALYAATFIQTAFGYLSVDNILKSQGKTDFNMKLGLTTSAIGLVLNLVLIPNFGVIGFLATCIVSGIPSLIIALWWIKKNFNATIDWRSSTKIVFASALASAITYAVTSQLNMSSWISLAIGTVIFIVTYLIATPLVGAITQADVQNFKEMMKGYGPLSRIFNLLFSFIERLTTIFQRS
ncbi:MAG: oligosaccharide flippase family protein, partial [Candidatus Bathyarchaeota archaeon]|nr:oligosaccharide flippase family protein [Candidatus Bathyarchaeum sp.]